MGTQTVTADQEFDVLQFEKKLTSLKDSQESINSCCQWCLSNRQHHKKIVNSWLNVLKRVKVEHRLTLFYLANDVIQYSKRKHYEYVESWGTALQKATTMVRDDKVKQKILRIFKIWEDRSVYNEEFISDLCGLISTTPTGSKNDEPHEFQPNYVINKIKLCSNLESDTDLKLKLLKEHKPKSKILETDNFCNSLKDRAHLDDSEKEVDTYVKYMEDYINALKTEIKSRITLISVLKQAETQLESDRKDVKIVANAYKSFGTRVKTFQKKLQEHMTTLSSPVLSPEFDAPSPNSDSDIDLPDNTTGQTTKTTTTVVTTTQASAVSFVETIQFPNANYYNPVPPPTTEASNTSMVSNGFTSFIGSNLPFNLQNFNSSLFSNKTNSPALQTTSNLTNLTSLLSQPPPPPVETLVPPPVTPSSAYPYTTIEPHIPLLPPPMPPFSTKEDTNYTNTISYNSTPSYGSRSYNSTAPYEPTEKNFSYSTTPSDGFDPINNLFSNESTFEPPAGSNPYPPAATEEYNPEQELETWENDASWTQPPPLDTDTPESPPAFEKESYVEPIEYHDNAVQSGIADVDHRVLPTAVQPELPVMKLRAKDVDHRNLISLIGSPATDSNSNSLPNVEMWPQGDQDYRNSTNKQCNDQDYRMPFDLEQLKLPPPPPPPTKTTPIPVRTAGNINKKQAISPIKYQDNIESIDMDLSDDDIDHRGEAATHRKVPTSETKEIADLQDNFNDLTQVSLLEPPPPFPDLSDDVEATTFLDSLDNDLNEFLMKYDDETPQETKEMWTSQMAQQNNALMSGPPPPMQQMNFPVGMPPPPIMPMNNWTGDPGPGRTPNPHSGNFQFRGRGNSRGNFQNRGGPGQHFRNRGRPHNGNFNNFENFNNGNFRGGNNFRGRGGGRPMRSGPRLRNNRGFRGAF